MIKILAIGNSFSQDATAYLHDIAKCGNINTKVVNLYIGGCSLYTHSQNIETDAPNYEYELNGLNTGRKVSVKEALLEDDWNFVTMQQASYDSGLTATYFPYIAQLSEYIKKYSPNAKQFIHQTWAYETDSGHEAFIRYENNQETMYKALKSAYQKAAETLGLPIILCGDVIQTLRGLVRFDYPNGGLSLCRDGFHLSLIYGRYAAAATWYETILNGNILENNFLQSNGESNDINLIHQTVHTLCHNNNKLHLVIPTIEHKREAMEYRRECIEFGPSSHISGSGGLSRYERYEEWLDKTEMEKSNPKPNLVPATMYFAVYNNKIVGSIQIRHYLNEPLLIRGGHIGYGVRPCERKKGFATKMLSLALEECKKLGIDKALVTCDKDNIGSAKTIQKNGGVLENEFVDDAGGIVQRYWIDVK